MPRKPKPPPQCGTCKAPLIFARIGRWAIPLDPAPAADGTVAAYVTSTGGRVGRWLAKTEQPFSHEKRYRQHRCPKPEPAPKPEPLPDLFSTLTD
jgi:hypothetical protein